MILIAGGTGIIGSYLLKSLNNEFRLSILEIDLLNKSDINNDLKKIKNLDCLIFLVGLAHSKGKNKELRNFKDINFSTLRNLIEELSNQDKLPKKIIFSSTISTYGESINKSFYNEEDLLEGKSPYAKTKISAEEFLRKNFPNSSWILRFAPVYSKSFTLNLIRRTNIKGIFFRCGKGEIKLSLCNIFNIQLVIKKILKNEVPYGIYNISDPREYTYNDILENLNAKNILYLPRLLFWAHILLVDYSIINF